MYDEDRHLHFLAFLYARDTSSFYFCGPDGIALIVESHTHISVVGVDAACLAIDVPFLV